LVEVIVRFKLLVLTALMLMTLRQSAPCLSQEPTQGKPSRPNLDAPDAREKEEQEQVEKEMAKKANQERQSQLQRDADRLLKLATELKQYVDKTNEHTLSLDVIKKAEEIEKLAHSVKEKMKAN
jgi:hypothetical protein